MARACGWHGAAYMERGWEGKAARVCSCVMRHEFGVNSVIRSSGGAASGAWIGDGGCRPDPRACACERAVRAEGTHIVGRPRACVWAMVCERGEEHA
eukprot:6046155-Prymnesium_polylepis.3